uniref:OTU domain-containing protein n=1 Tax=Corethron hystrix TaxID=216773 RepID=A0A7S1FUY1_9STRA|mmetsp:Transcript_33074/g.76221  ORF Transcript_33074/g.76221 Transcript_33074/m.76221 type:complete len:290 (+) Transcript_33074:219-1088(+)|eukprot:CAMPEP_0113316510 /NCGR_PEP_ID=MMETSP0010_2-20120614/11761_1 /TAXON_ID=216773 ORGANISM="Corethron hystrix, Strain 308" /NCGR_SAMPLE_ID=MMETSP0010_2 /ASSEMBLY_ACC=CAM_ASM_000155 /LENGTH=289 /DNA_ID=CAMNT_0000173249 /DNA_START=148 /DNA_END=1017 /DNA_ORIENTATION=- /assembly_acc=CAM_ASM_000155
MGKSKSKTKKPSKPKNNKGQRCPTNISKKKKNPKKCRRGGNRLSEGNASIDDSQFRSEILMSSKSIREMAADGNCLFRALSDQLFFDWGRLHDQVRSDVMDYIEESPDEFKFFLYSEDDDDDDDEDIDEIFRDYVKSMREDAEWGGDVEIVAASRLYRRDITVYSPFGALNITCTDEKKNDCPILLSFHDNDHYNSVEDLGRKENMLPSKNKKSSRNESGTSNGHSKGRRNGKVSDPCDSENGRGSCKIKSRGSAKKKGSQCYYAVSNEESDSGDDTNSLDGQFKKIQI